MYCGSKTNCAFALILEYSFDYVKYHLKCLRIALRRLFGVFLCADVWLDYADNDTPEAARMLLQKTPKNVRKMQCGYFFQ